MADSLGMWDERDEADLMELEIPAATVLMHRTFPTYTESMWINGYPKIRTIVVTCPAVHINPSVSLPGVVRELPVGWRDMATAETFLTRFYGVVGSYEDQGWKRKDCAVYSGDPWDFADPTEGPAPF
jgi:hypothetical protein